MASSEQKGRRTTGAAVKAARCSPPDFHVVVRVVPDGGRALAKAREYVIARLLEEVLAEFGGDRCCGQ